MSAGVIYIPKAKEIHSHKRDYESISDRQVTSNLQRKFEGASHSSRTAGWMVNGRSVNETMKFNLKTLSDRAQYLTINNPYALTGLETIANHTVGKGIFVYVKGDDKFNSQLKKILESTEIDVDGRHNFYGIQHLVMKTLVKSGECLIKRVIRQEPSGRLRLQLQVLDSCFLDTSKGKLGIEFDRHGRRKFYWIFKENPNETLGKREQAKSVRVKAKDVLHVFKTDIPGQIRGFTWFAPIILRINDLDDYETAELVRQKIAACLVGFVSNDSGYGSNDKGDDVSRDMLDLEPGSIEFIGDKKIEFTNPPQPNTSNYIESQLRSIAAGIRVPYMILASNYTKVNYSSLKVAFTEFYKSIEIWRHHMLLPQLCYPVIDWCIEAMRLNDIKLSDKAQIVWTPPARDSLDAYKDAMATKVEMENGIVSKSDKIRQLGKDPEDVFEEQAKERQLIAAKNNEYKLEEVDLETEG